MDKTDRLFGGSPPTPAKIQVLLVEDDPDHMLLVKEYLAEEPTQPYELIHVETITEALEALQRVMPDVIVLDLSLPDAYGLEGLGWINEAAPSVPVVVHSSHNDQRIIEAAVKQGAQDYLVKGSYNTDLIHRVIRYAIERKQTLCTVQDSEKRLRSIIEHTSDGVVIVNANNEVVFANPAAETLLGSSVDDLLGKPFRFDLISEEATELEIVNIEGRIITVEMGVTPILWEGLSAVLASLRDITAHKQLQERLTEAKETAEELARLKSSFLATMSHELRTPLTGIMGFADILIKEISCDDHRDFARIIKQAGQQLLVTINSVLEMSQLEAGTVTVKQECIRVIEVAQETLALLDPLAKERGLSLDLTTYTHKDLILGDPILMQRILNNLVGNALKFTHEGSIVVEVDADDTHVYIRVKDTGPGITPSFMPYLFDQFSQESDGLRRSHAGSGLGLAITKKLVTLLGGTITVESEHGVGSTFTVMLPSAEQPAHVEARRSPTDSCRTEHPWPKTKKKHST